MTDAELVADAIAAERGASEARWRAADDYAELHHRGRTERWIAAEVGKSQQHINFCRACVADYPDSQTRGDFQEVYEAVQTKGRREREERLRRERAEATEKARTSGRVWDLVEADIREWRPRGVSAIVTDPPYITDDAIDLYSALADFAVDVLPDGGALATLAWQPILEDVMIAMARPELRFRWMIAWLFDRGGSRTYDMRRRVHDGWKPVLVYHKGEWARDETSMYDTIDSEGRILDDHVWQQSLEATGRLVRYVSEPGDTVCDPFAGSCTTGIAAMGLERDFVGADIDAMVVALGRSALAA